MQQQQANNTPRMQKKRFIRVTHKKTMKKKTKSSSSSSEDNDKVEEMAKTIDYERMPMVPKKIITSVPKVPDYMLREQALREEEDDEVVEAIEEEDKSLDEVINAMKNLVIRQQLKAVETHRKYLLSWLHENHISLEQTQRNAWRSIFFESNVSETLSEQDLQNILDAYITEITPQFCPSF